MVTEEDNPKAKLRNAFRVNDHAILFHRLAASEDLENPLGFNVFSTEQNYLLEALQTLNTKSYQALSDLNEQDPNLAEYLNIIDTKLNLLAESILYPESAAQAKKQMVNISETGLGFGSAAPYDVDTFVCLKLTLFPSYQVIRAIGKVVRSNSVQEEEIYDPNFPYWTAVYFKDISKVQQQTLVKHLLQLQAKELREKRQNSE